MTAICGETPTEELPELSSEEVLRYSRHLILPEVTVTGQRKLKAARVLLVGAGGLGSPAALYLAAAGVGRIGIVDFDEVDLTNLQRQILHGTDDVGRKKVDSARDRLAQTNPNVKVVTHDTFLTSENALEIIGGYDLVVDGTDNFATRYLVNDACVLLGKPNVYGSIFRFDGQASVLATEEGPCYRCIYPEPPPPNLVPSCAEGGVLGVLPGLVGVIQATEAIKLIIGAGEPLIGRLLLVDAASMRFRTMKLRRNPECPACGTREITGLTNYREFCGLGKNVDFDLIGVPEISPLDLAKRLETGEAFDLLDVRQPEEWQIGKIPRARLVPLDTLTESLSELDSARDIVVYCRSGIRSARAVNELKSAGFERVWNLSGGIIRWSDEVDSSVPIY